MDKVKEYLEKLRQTNPSLLAPENRGELMKMMSQEFNVEFRSELALTNFAKNKGFELSAFEKKNDVQNEGMDLDSQQDQKPSSLELPSTPIQDGGVVVDLSAAQKRSNYVSDLRRRERFLIKDDLYSGITADFLDTDEKQVKIALTKELIGKGFQINEKEAGANALEIVASNGNKLDVDLSYDLEDRFGDLFETQIQETPLGIGPTVASTMVTAAGRRGTNRSMNLITQSKKIREFLKENTSDLSFTLQNEFSQNKSQAITKLFNGIYKTDKPYPVDQLLADINQKISEKKKSLDEKTYKAVYPGERRPAGFEEMDLEATQLTKELKELESSKTSLLRNKNVFSKTAAEIINNAESLNGFGDKDIQKMVDMGLDVKDLKLHGIEIDGARASYNELEGILKDDGLRRAVKSGEISLKVNMSGSEQPLIAKLMEDAVALEETQMSGSYVGSIFRELGATTLETLDNVSSAVMDIQAAIAAKTLKLANKTLMGDRYNPDDIDDAFESLLASKHPLLINKAKEIREGQLQVKGDLLSSESVQEFMFKGGKAAAQSAPIMAMYMMSPELGLGITGMNSYGSSIKEMKEIRDYINQTGDPTGMYNGYRDLTLNRARAISATRALTETAFTAAFTYNFLKGLSANADKLSGMSRNEARKLIDFYSKSFVSNITKTSTQAVAREIPEEELITVSNMYLDELYGLKDYSMKDYTRAMKNTAVSIPFSTLPLSGVAYRKMNKTSKDFVRSQIARYSISDKLQADYDALNDLDAAIEQMGESKASRAILDERNALAERINKEHDRKTQAIMDNASDAQIVEMSKIMIDLKEKTKQYLEETQPRMKKLLGDEMAELNKRAEALLESIGVKETSARADVDVERNNILANNPKPYKQAVDVVEKIQDFLDSETVDNKFFLENKAKFEEMSKFLSEITSDDLSSEQKKLISEMYAAINKNVDWHVGFDRFYNRLVEADKIASRIIAARPTSEKIKPMTRLESLFTGYKGGAFADRLNMANLNHVLSFMFKNDRMGAPIKNLSGRIDAKANEIKNKVDAEKIEFSKGTFLKGKVTKARLEALMSESSMAEMMILSELRKQRADETPEQNFARKKAILEQNKEQLKKFDDSEEGRKVQKIYSEAFNKLFNVPVELEGKTFSYGSKNLSDVYSRANRDVVEAVVHLSTIFEPIKGDVFERMENYYGKEPTVFSRYIPSIISKMGSENSNSRNSDYEGFVSGPMSMQETITYDKISDTDKVFLYENWASMVFKSKENMELELGLRDDIDIMKGVVGSKTFENIFDTESKSFDASTEGDFAFLKGILNNKLNSLDSSILSITSAMPRTITKFEDFVNTVTKLTTALRLTTVGMRTSQASSAMLAAMPIVGSKARQMLVSSMVKFSSGSLTADIESNKNFLEVLKKSSTSRRGSGQQILPLAFTDRPVKRRSTSISGKTFDLLAEKSQKASEFALDVALGQSDKIAGQATWAAFYYDRMVQTRGSEIKNMNFDQFWAWSKDNTDMDAVAWADSQVDRSQMLANDWNNGKAFNGKLWSNVLFPFGRFAYNRKVGMANDWSIINDDLTATDADKAKAKRRLASAAIEIGIFKMIQPTVSILVTQAAAGYVSGLFGFDEEYDKRIETFKKDVGNINPTGDLPMKDKFMFSNYKMDLSKQLKTAMVEGMMPLPTPSAVNEIIFAAVNKASGDEVFNVFSEDIRSVLDAEDRDAFSFEGAVDILANNSGLVGLALEDAINILNATVTETGRFPNRFGGEDRWVVPEALPAAEFLKEYRKINIFIQSADLKKILDKTERLLQRKYTVTNKPDYDAYREMKDGQGKVDLKQKKGEQ